MIIMCHIQLFKKNPFCGFRLPVNISRTCQMVSNKNEVSVTSIGKIYFSNNVSFQKYIFPIIYICEKLKTSFNDNLYYIATKV